MGICGKLTFCHGVEKALIPETDMEDVAEAWVKHYKAHQLAALRDLINLVIRVRSRLHRIVQYLTYCLL